MWEGLDRVGNFIGARGRFGLEVKRRGQACLWLLWRWVLGRGCSQRCAKRRASDLHVPLETRGLRKHNDVANGTPPGVWFSKPQCLKREERGWGRVDTIKT